MLNIKKLSVAATIIAAFFLFYHMAMITEINSDMASGILEAHDLASGNVFLNGWSLSTVPFYFTDIVWYAIVICFTGISYKLNYVFSALSLLSLCIAMISASECKKTAAAITFFTLGSPVAFMAQNLLTPVVHVGTYIFSLCIFILSKKYVKTPNKKTLALVYIIMSLTYFSDAMSMYLVFVPLIVTAISYALWSRVEKGWVNLVVVSVLAYLTSLLIWSVFSKYGFVIPGLQETKFATTKVILKNISDLFEGSLKLYSAYFFGLRPKSPGVAQICLSFLTLTIFFSLLFYRALSIKYNRGQDIFLLSATLIMPIAFIVSDISVGLGSIRYILPFFIFGTVFACGIGVQSRLNKRSLYALIVLFITSSAFHVKENLESPKANERYKQINQALNDNGLNHGFASYWDSSSVSIYGGVIVAPVYPSDNGIMRFNWLSKSSWYDDDNRFVIIENDNMKKSATMSFGMPDKVIHAGGKEIYVWNRKIHTVD